MLPNIKTIENFINQALQTDENASAQLAYLNNSTLFVHLELITTVKLFTVKFNTTSITISSAQHDEIPNEFQVATRRPEHISSVAYSQYVSSESSEQQLRSLKCEGYTHERNIYVAGTLTAFATLLISKNPVLAQKQGLTFRDPEQLSQHVKTLFLQLDIDWEEQLAGITGDLAAHHINKFSRTAVAEIKQLSTNFTEMLSEFILEELRATPTRLELDEFHDTVATLRSQLARLEARYELL